MVVVRPVVPSFSERRGALFSPDDYGARYFLLPEKDFDGYKPPAQTLPRIPIQGRW